MTHKDAAGLPIDNWGIVKQLSDSALDELMAVCHTEPADGDECVCCAAYMESQEHRRRIDTLEAENERIINENVELENRLLDCDCEHR